MCGVTHSYVWRDLFICGIRHNDLFICGIRHNDLFICGIRHNDLFTCGIRHNDLFICGIRHNDLFICGIRHNDWTQVMWSLCLTWVQMYTPKKKKKVTSHMWINHVTHTNVWYQHRWKHYDSSTCVLPLMWWHDPFICVTCLIHMSHIWPCHEVMTSTSVLTWHIEWAMSHIWLCHVTHMNEPCHIYDRVMNES